MGVDKFLNSVQDKIVALDKRIDTKFVSYDLNIDMLTSNQRSNFSQLKDNTAMISGLLLRVSLIEGEVINNIK